MMDNPEYIYIWVNPDEMAIAICTSEKSNKDALKVPDKRECEIYSTGLFEELKKANRNLCEECTYRLIGEVSKGKKVARFSINANVDENRRL